MIWYFFAENVRKPITMTLHFNSFLISRDYVDDSLYHRSFPCLIARRQQLECWPWAASWWRNTFQSSQVGLEQVDVAAFLANAIWRCWNEVKWTKDKANERPLALTSSFIISLSVRFNFDFAIATCSGRIVRDSLAINSLKVLDVVFRDRDIRRHYQLSRTRIRVTVHFFLHTKTLRHAWNGARWHSKT